MKFEENDAKVERKTFVVYFLTIFSAKFICTRQVKMGF